MYTNNEIEQEILLKDKLLSAVAEAMNELVKKIDFHQAVNNAFNSLGRAINVDRIVLFENKVDEKTGKVLSSYSQEWVSDPSYTQLNDPMLQNIPIENVPEVFNTLFNKKPLIANTRDIEPVMRGILEAHKVQSVMLFPIYIENRFWGYVGFDDCKNERIWSEAEKAILTSFAASIASIIEKDEAVLHQAELNADIRQKATNEKTLRQIMLSSVYSFDFENIIHTMVTETGELMKSDRCFYVGFDLRTDCNHAIEEYAEHLSSSDILTHRAYPFKKADTIAFSTIARMHKVITCDDVSKIELPEASRRMMDFLSVKSYLMASVFYGETYYGAIVLHYVNYKTFTQTDVEIMEAVANQTALILRQAELYRALSQTTGKTESILNNIADGVITVNQHGLIETANPAIEKMFGYSTDELFERPIAMLFPPEKYINCEAQGFLLNDECYIKNNVINNTDYIATRRDGTTFYVETTMSSVPLEKGILSIFLIRDVTQRKKVEKLKNEFISTVSHELRTPISSIMGSLSLVLSGIAGELTEKAKGLLTIASSNSDRLLALINDILDIEKIESGKMDFDIKPIEIMPVVEQAIESNSHYAQQYKVVFELENSLPEARVHADKNRLMQVMTNLLSNAAKFSFSGGKVKIYVEEQNNNIKVSINNHGDIIPIEFYEHIFQKFAQADSSDSREKGGTGLGLNICKSIIERMNGNIGFTSDSETGTTFYFDLPEVLNTVKKVEESDK